jgi:hypothetical protein
MSNCSSVYWYRHTLEFCCCHIGNIQNGLLPVHDGVLRVHDGVLRVHDGPPRKVHDRRPLKDGTDVYVLHGDLQLVQLHELHVGPNRGYCKDCMAENRK